MSNDPVNRVDPSGLQERYAGMMREFVEHPTLADANTLGAGLAVAATGAVALAAEVPVVYSYCLFNPNACTEVAVGAAELAAGVDGPTVSSPSAAVSALTSYYPPNNGFLGATEEVVLKAGQLIDRYGGSAVSRYFSPIGTALEARSLPPANAAMPLRTFEVLQDISVDSGTVAPWFGQFGFGTQYRTTLTLQEMLDQGLVREVD
ncbi:MAG: TNT domain-containing protein [Thermoanaerobaculia bacterium]|nr:MAG: TNT domain-containing protein [Thermoanaerobaculia bacterium]